MRVPVDKTRRNHMALGIQHFFRGFADATDRGDLALNHADIRAVTRHAGTIHYRTILDDQIVLHCGLRL